MARVILKQSVDCVMSHSGFQRNDLEDSHSTNIVLSVIQDRMVRIQIEFGKCSESHHSQDSHQSHNIDTFQDFYLFNNRYSIRSSVTCMYFRVSYTL